MYAIANIVYGYCTNEHSVFYSIIEEYFDLNEEVEDLELLRMFNESRDDNFKTLNELEFSNFHMANTVTGTCRVWDEYIEETGELGDCSHLDLNPEDAIVLQSNSIYWIHDRTPHESLACPYNTPRQFFRLVTNNTSLWYSEHNTPNPLGVKPDCEVVKGNKFKK